MEIKLKKIVDLKIYLRSNLSRIDIDESFIKRLSYEYANQFLEKADISANPYNIEKLLQIRPFESCDFQMITDTIGKKNVKILQIFPNREVKQGNMLANLQKSLSNDEFENIMLKTAKIAKEGADDKITAIKKKQVTKEEMLLFQPDTVELMIHKAKEGIEDRKLYLQSHGLIEQQIKGFDLSIESIRKKYINPSSQIIINSNEATTGAAKFQNIDKVSKKEIINNPEFEFPYLEVKLSKDILQEINKPLEVNT
jgi:hypothetical protein